MDPSTLRRHFLDRVVRHAHQHHPGNYAVDRYGPGGEGKVAVGQLRGWMEFLLDHMDDLAWLWDRLGDDASRAVLLECMLYNSLGHLKVRRSTHTPAFQAAMRGGPSCGGAAQVVEVAAHQNGRVPLHRYRVRDGALTVLASRGFVFTHVLHHQYQLHRPGVDVAVGPGDVVLDCGACRGDTALWFASFAGPEGAVHSFEFVPDNLVLFRQNLAANPALAARVTLVEHALGATSGEELRFDPNGAGTRVGRQGALAVTTRSIDDHVAAAGLSRVDYVKMDIEGSEEAALRGAAATLRRFTPKLGISVYHKPGDWWTLARTILELEPRYRLYLAHHTIFDEETVLYARVD